MYTRHVQIEWCQEDLLTNTSQADHHRPPGYATGISGLRQESVVLDNHLLRNACSAGFPASITHYWHFQAHMPGLLSRSEHFGGDEEEVLMRGICLGILPTGRGICQLIRRSQDIYSTSLPVLVVQRHPIRASLPLVNTLRVNTLCRHASGAGILFAFLGQNLSK